ncbi:MAG: SUMF1/EgtB/PvdO family nonheme iron enzyme [Myxococcales bacterium]|nr:SUMF1/EgtB/PvdO family nonheme iron enzyme [Myxococcales bacterium]
MTDRMADPNEVAGDVRLGLTDTAWANVPLDDTLLAPAAQSAKRDAELHAAATKAPPALRYVLGDVLGVGGMGEVTMALDRETGRTLALKTLRVELAANAMAVRRFVTEARVTAQLEHPAVVPVYDLGVLPDRRLYYTMRIVRQRSLRSVLEHPSGREDWPLARLCTVFIQVCRAIAYAHSRGVVHRDLKPENILLGDFGEVYVADWGIAKVLGNAELTPSVAAGTADSSLTAVGAAIGTLGYMAPEQIRGEADLDGAADVFALGVILYELLTRSRPFDGPTAAAIVLATSHQEPSAPRFREPSCPAELEELCLSMLVKDRKHRLTDAGRVADAVELFLEGSKERARRREQAESLAGEAVEHSERHRKLGEEQDVIRSRARDALKHIKTWDPVEKKRPGWALEDRAREIDKEEARELAHASERFAQALGYDRESELVRRRMAELYWNQADRCERRRDEPGQIYYEELVREYDDGTYVAKLTAKATLSVDSHVRGADVIAHRLGERDRILRPDAGQLLGTTPVVDVTLEPGSWLLVLRKAGYRDVRYPVLARRGERFEATVNLYTDEEIGDGMVYVPGGSSLVGGDPEAFEPLPRQMVEVPDFAIGRFQVTFAEYLEFVADLELRDEAWAMKRLPRAMDTGEGAFAERDSEGRWVPRWDILVEGEKARELCRREEAGSVPVCCVDWFDAVAFCRWRSEREGRTVRLPTELEWEKAARGVDGRWFPWGDRFDPSFSKMRESRPGFGQPEPVGTFPTDESPYGVRDLAGGMRTWVGDLVGELTAERALLEPEPLPGQPFDQNQMRLSRNGAWNNLPNWCRSASRLRHVAGSRLTGLGMRVARTLSPRS